MKTLPRPRILTALVGCLALSACIFGTSPAKLNKLIEGGNAARALTTIEEELTSSPEDPTYNLLAIKARLALCHQRNCVAETPGLTPPLLSGLPKLAGHVTGPVTLAKDISPLTVTGVFTQAMAQYQAAAQQPAAVLTVYTNAPAAVQPAIASGLFQPALTLARRGNPEAAGKILEDLAKTETIPQTYTYAARMLSAMLGHQPSGKDANLIALRSVTTPPLPSGAAALMPWAILAESGISNTAPETVLATLPRRLESLNLPGILNANAMSAMAQELLAASTNSTAANQWQSTPAKVPSLALQRMALFLDPNQPDLWATYLPALVTAATIQTSSSLAALGSLEADLGGNLALPAVSLSSNTAPRVATEVIRAATQLLNHPSVATPLVTFASRLPLTKQQEIDLEKLSQSLLLKAAEQGDVTSTVVLAQTLPGVAQNNRQSVVPLLVKFIRGNLRDGNFEAATTTAELLTNTLKMDVEFAPLVLEEFADDVKRRGITEALSADTPEKLLQPADIATLDLGPLFTFMQSYFEDQPKVITSQLTTLVAGATGIYGQPTAMYRLGSYFPAETLPAAKQQEWLAASLEQALLADPTLTPVTLAETSARLAALHPGLNLAPLLDAAIRHADTLEEQRALWQAATPALREVLRTTRPEFMLLMQGIDALAAGQLNTSAQAFSGLTDPTWRNEAKPFLEQFNERLITLSGVYVPVSAVPALKTAAIIIAPQGLIGGRLNSVSLTFISRVGTLTESEPVALRTNAAAVHRFSLALPYNFDTRSIAVQPNLVAQAPKGGTFGATFGTIRTLKLQGEGESPMLNVTLADGATTPFIRTLLDPSQPLRPDGTYALQARMGNAPSATQGIMPPASMLTFTTSANPVPATPEADTTSPLVYPLSGTLRHPASAQPITFTGFFDPDLLTTTFTFNYPLPTSAQPARAAVRCQALAGPITCGAHNLNSARQAYAALVTGLQTRESLATSAAQRSTLNALASSHILADAIPEITLPSPTLTISSTAGLVGLPTTPAISATTGLTATTPTVPVTASPSLLSSPTAVPVPTPPVSTSVTETEEEALPEEPEPSPAKPFSTEPEPGAFINHSGGNGPVSPTAKP